MQRIHLRTVDLNLLVVFDAVMSERSVTRAAYRLHLTQPAVSHALSRLRALFKDPLFLRTPAGLEPTPRSSALAGRVAAVLSEIGSIFVSDMAFDPATSERRFAVGMSHYAAFVVLSSLVARLKRLAPSVQLIVHHTSHVRGLDMLERGEVELIVGNFPKPSARIASELLFKEDFLCAARRGHPAFTGKLTLQRYVSLDHLQVSLSGEPAGYVDAVLRRRKHRRMVSVTVGHFLVAPPILARTDLVATEPARILRPAAEQLGLAVQPPPLALPAFDVVQMWPRRLTAEPANAWLRAVILESANERL